MMNLFEIQNLFKLYRFDQKYLNLDLTDQFYYYFKSNKGYKYYNDFSNLIIIFNFLFIIL